MDADVLSVEPAPGASRRPGARPASRRGSSAEATAPLLALLRTDPALLCASDPEPSAAAVPFADAPPGSTTPLSSSPRAAFADGSRGAGDRSGVEGVDEE